MKCFTERWRSTARPVPAVGLDGDLEVYETVSRPFADPPADLSFFTGIAGIYRDVRPHLRPARGSGSDGGLDFLTISRRP